MGRGRLRTWCMEKDRGAEGLSLGRRPAVELLGEAGGGSREGLGEREPREEELRKVVVEAGLGQSKGGGMKDEVAEMGVRGAAESAVSLGRVLGSGEVVADGDDWEEEKDGHEERETLHPARGAGVAGGTQPDCDQCD